MKFTKKGKKYIYEFDEKEEYVMFFIGTNPKMKNRKIKTVTQFVQHMSHSGVLLSMGTIDTWLHYFKNIHKFELEPQDNISKHTQDSLDTSEYIG